MTEGKLVGKIALITGAASGLGKATALRFAKEGAKIAIADLNLEGAKKVVKEIKSLGDNAIAIQCDVSDEKQVVATIDGVIKKFGNIDILVNFAGASPIPDIGVLKDMTSEKWDKMIGSHVRGTFLFCKYALQKGMNNGGRIVNTSSIEGISGGALASGYSAAKAAVIGLTKSLAREVGSKGITVNAIAPGIIAGTGMSDQVIPMAQGLNKCIPLRRLGELADIANLVTFLASSEASYITGQVIVIDGGWILTMATPAEMRGLVESL